MAGPAKYPLQTKFWKSFGRYGIFLGTVVGYDSDGGYKCYYEGDGDEENLTEEEIDIWLKRYPSVTKKNQGAAKKKRTEYQPNKERARKPTPEKKQSRKGPPEMVAAKTKHKAHEDKWKENLQKLKAFQEANGHTRVSLRWSQDPSLGSWVIKQRQQYKEGTMLPHRQALLEQEGFEFGPQARIRSWDDTYQLLVDYKNKCGGISNITYQGPHKSLYIWMKNQKKKHREGTLPADRKRTLEKLGLKFEHQKRTFEENFHLLLEFQKIHGHTNVPRQHQDQQLANFVHCKRDQCRANQIPQAQRQELEKIGFQFRVREKPRTFEENYELLLEFKEEFGHLPKNCQCDKSLWFWVQHVRSGNTKLNEIQKKKLDEIGFEWRQLRAWQESFDALVSYKKEHGNCSVPLRYKKDTALGFWVYRHKKPKRYNALSPKQKDQLKAVGFHPNHDDTRTANALEPNRKASHASKSKKHKASTNTRDTQEIFQRSNQATQSTRATKQRARLRIENQMDQESSKYDSASDSYDSDESSASEESIGLTLVETALSMDEDATSVEIGIGNQQDHPEEVMSSQAEDRRSGSEVAPDQTDSSITRAQSTGAARCHPNASQVVPDLARSATTPTASTHSRTRAKPAEPDTATSKSQTEKIVPNATESMIFTSAPATRTNPSRGLRKRPKEEPESNKKPRWLFD